MCMERPKSFVIAKFAEAARLVFPEVVTLYYMIDRETRDEVIKLVQRLFELAAKNIVENKV